MAPEKACEIESWLRFAEDDWSYARHGQQDFPRGAAWNYHQAAEKYLKAVLLDEGTEPPRTHDLLHLVSLLRPALPADHTVVRAAAAMKVFGPARRYPGDLPEVTPSECAKTALACDTIRQFALARIGADAANRGPAAAST
jgi:HEPN domain-containing protein